MLKNALLIFIVIIGVMGCSKKETIQSLDDFDMWAKIEYSIVTEEEKISQKHGSHHFKDNDNLTMLNVKVQAYNKGKKVDNIRAEMQPDDIFDIEGCIAISGSHFSSQYLETDDVAEFNNSYLFNINQSELDKIMKDIFVDLKWSEGNKTKVMRLALSER